MTRFIFLMILVFVVAGVLFMNSGLMLASILCYLFSIGLYGIGVWELKRNEPQTDIIEGKIMEAIKGVLLESKPAIPAACLAEVADAYAKLSEGSQHRIPWYDKAMSRLGIIAFLAMATTSISQFASQGMLSKEAAYEEKRLQELREKFSIAKSEYHTLAEKVFKSARVAEIPDWENAGARQRQVSALAASFFVLRPDFENPPSEEEFLKWAVEGEQWHVVEKAATRQQASVSRELRYKIKWFSDTFSTQDAISVRKILTDHYTMNGDSQLRAEVPSLICFLLHRDKIFRKPISQSAVEITADIDIGKVAASVNSRPDELLERIQQTSERLVNAKSRYLRMSK